jgi:hypothetical protein
MAEPRIGPAVTLEPQPDRLRRFHPDTFGAIS